MDTSRTPRLTFGYGDSDTPTFSSLPPSPLNPTLERQSSYPLPSIITTFTSTSSSTTTSSESPELKSTSLPIMHATSGAEQDTKIAIPLRTSSISPSSSVANLSLPSPPPSPLSSPTALAAYRSRPTSRCSSINSCLSFNSSLDHRSMPRVSHTRKSLMTSETGYDKPLPLTPQAKEQKQRAAFLSSPPVRSQVSLTLRSKSVISLASQSVSSLTLPSVSNPNMFISQVQATKSSTELDLCMKRWSNDSTRGLYGSVMSTSGSSPSIATVASPRASSSSGSEFDGFDDPYESDSNEEVIDSTLFNDYDFDIQMYPSLKGQSKKKKAAGGNINNRKSLFNFMKRK